MKTVSEVRIGRNTGYVVEIKDVDGRYAISHRTVSTEVHERFLNGRHIRLVYDADMHVQNELSEYLMSPDVSRKAPNTINKIIDRIKLFSNFLQINPELSVWNFGRSEVSMYIAFLQGVDIVGGAVRSNATVNHALDTLRDLFEFLSIDCKAINSKLGGSSKNGIYNNRYRSNLKDGSSSLEAPMYITPEKLWDLFRVVSAEPTRYTGRIIRAKQKLDSLIVAKKKEAEELLGMGDSIPDPIPLPGHDEQCELIILLAVLRGMRLGEILGLTMEDIAFRQNSSGRTVYGVYIRNRLSDAAYQHCKNLMHPRSKSDYESRAYRSKLGTRFIPLSEELYNKLLTFAKRETQLYSVAYPENEKDLHADWTRSNMKGQNTYVFIGRFGKRLTDQTWGNHLRELYIKALIPVDNGVRAANLTHRLRHSMAMILVHGGADILELQGALRHESPSSSKDYYNPTEEDMRLLFESFDRDVYGFMKSYDDIFAGED